MPNQKNGCERVAIFAFDDFSPFEFGIAIELFAANRIGIDDWYETFVFSHRQETIRTKCGINVTVEYDLDSLQSADKILIPGWRVTDQLPEPMVVALRDAHQRGAELISFCQGAFAIAATGLLDGRRATTHWSFADQFRQLFPEVEFVDGVLFVNEERIATSAGSAAAIDLGLHIIRRDFGVQVANQIAQRMVVAPARDGSQRQYIERPVQDETNGIAESMDWAVRNISRNDLTINMMAGVASLSRRSFDRNFRKVTGQTPNEWMNFQRLTRAAELLVATSYTIERVASDAGFGSATSFRQKFNRHFGQPPSQYRKS